MVQTVRSAALAAAFVAAVTLGRALAQPAVATGEASLAWSTYLRAGPSSAASVIDELFHDTAVTITGCGDRWCQVRVGRTVGYVDRDALALPRPAPPARTGAQNCFAAGLDSYHGKAPVRFCSTQGAPRDASP